MGIRERKERERGARRLQIIESARKVFVERGPEGSSMDEIADLAELSKGTLYLYFRNKEELHFEVMMDGIGRLKRWIDDLIISDDKGLENLAQTGEAYIRFADSNPDDYAIIMQYDSRRYNSLDGELKLKVLSSESPLSLLMATVRKGQADGSIRRDMDPEALGLLLWANLTGVLQLLHYRGKILDLFGLEPEEMIRREFEILIRGIEA